MQKLRNKKVHGNVTYRRLGSSSAASTSTSSDENSESFVMGLSPVEWLPPAIQPIPAIVGGIMVHLTLGALYSIGNMAPYITSYLRFRVGETVSTSDAAWLTSMSTVGQGATLVLGGILERYIGPRLAAMTGCALVSAGTMLTYYTVQKSFWGTAVTFGLLFGFGVGIGYAPCIVCATRWIPEKKGLIIGLIVGGFGCGALIFNQIQTGYVNPHNLQADTKVGDQNFFSQDELLDRVPKAFLVIGGCYLAMQLIGTLLMFDAPENRSQPITDPELADVDTDDHETVTNRAAPKEFRSLEPLKVLRSPCFYVIWFTFLFNGQISNFISAFYKFYGQQAVVKDDHFLAITGSCVSIFNALGRIFWGTLADRFSYQVAMSCMTVALVFLFLTFQYAHLAGKVFYFIWVVLIFGSFSGSFVLLPFATARCFGQHYLGVNYGMVFTSQVITSIISALLANSLLHKISYTGMFFMLAGFASVSFILTTLIGRTQHGKPDPMSSDPELAANTQLRNANYYIDYSSTDTE